MASNTAHIDQISKKATSSQLASFRIEGISISKRKAEQIRREVIAELSASKSLTR